MKSQKIILVLFSLIVIVSCKQNALKSAITKESKWYKGNLHTHSYWSDGDEFPEPILDWYKSQGYHFLSLTDHNTLAEGDKWIEIKADSIYQNAFKKYLDTYGSKWVEYKIDSGKTLAFRRKPSGLVSLASGTQGARQSRSFTQGSVKAFRNSTRSVTSSSINVTF